MLYLNMFFQRITSDFRQKELLPLKLLFFVHASTLYVLYPYLTIHMRELGINVEEAAIMSAVTPVVAIIMPPLAGIAADRIGNFKFILALCSVLGGTASLLLLLIPVGRITFTYPERSILSLSCPINAEGMLSLSMAEQHPCVMLPSVLGSQINNKSLQIESQLEACGLICTRHTSEFVPYVTKGPQTVEAESAAILRTRNYTVVITDLNSNTSEQYMYTLQADDLPLFRAPTAEDLDKRNFRLMKNKKHYQTSVRQLTEMTYFFPTSGLYNLTCEMDSVDNLTNIYVCNIMKSNAEFIPSVLRSKAESFSIRVKSELGRHAESIKTLYVTEINPVEDNSTNNNGYIDTTCGYDNATYSLSVLVPLLNPENSLEVDSLLDMMDCKPSCIVTMPRSKLCSNLETTVEYDISLTFWLYLVVRVFIGMISGTAFAMFEGAVIAILREHKADYGLQRIYAAIGGMLSSPLSGMLIDYASEGKGYTDFRPAFYLYAGLKTVSGMLMLTINLEFKSPATNVVADVLSVLKNIEIVALFITCFILGTAWGYIESFLFWLLQDLGASRSLMGITITIGGIAGLPLLVMSGPIIDRIGHANVLFIGFIFYAIRLLGYSLIYNPWMCLIFEAMESVTSSLAITAAVTYAAKLSTNTTDSSIQGLLGGLYFGVGKGAGSLVGGYLMKAVGTRPTYQIFAAVMFITGILYYIFNHIYIASRQTTGQESQSQEKKPPPDCKNSVAFEKQKEAEVVSICQNNINSKLGNHIIENIPLKSAVTSIKNYSANEKNKNKKGMSNNTNCDKIVDPGGSEKINLGFEEDEEKTSNLRNKLHTQADDTRSQEKR